MNFKKASFEQFFHTNRIGTFAVSKDESKLIYMTDVTGNPNLWAIDLKVSTTPYLFAKYDESVSFIKISPDNEFVLAGFDKDGNENTQIYALPIQGGYPEPLVTGDASEKYYFAELSEDGKRLYYMTSESNPNFLNTHVRDLETQEDKLLEEGAEAPTYLTAVSKDETLKIYTKLYSNTHQKAYIKTDTETIWLLPEEAKPPYTIGETIITDDRRIYFVTDYQSERSYLVRFDLESRQSETVLSFKNESITEAIWHEESETFILATTAGVTDNLYRFDPTTRDIEELVVPIHVLSTVRVAKSGTIYLSGSSSIMPVNIFCSVDGVHWESLTENRVLGIDSTEMVEPETVQFKSFDGLSIEALLFRAAEETANGYTIFWPHGGPQAAERQNFRALFQALVYNGYTIFAPNFRGSTGYGKTFATLVEQDWGEAPRLDNVASIEWLFEQGIASKDSLFLVGGSYGGYMSLLLHGRHPEYFRAVVDLFGPSNLFSFYNSVPPHWKPIMKLWLGDPEEDREKFIADSPITYLDTMTKPMLVIQGAQDPRVIQEESDQIVEKLIEKQRDVTYMVLEDEGHGFARKENEIKVYKKVMAFLEEHQR
ncbi:S9 family peptidase [Marinilactibacillus piezotolerans]|uniref:S9 family peptidase n=1 Tax=Marinilactibacillus piezotolerans TaxID=258723 RepID=UPI001C4DDEB8|nr:alpha/beta fold hydrolase [Marinilactibacillus piezotolerans]